MKKPVIGVVAYPYTDSDGDRIYEVNSNIIEMLVKNEARPISIYPTQMVNYQDDDFDTLPKLTNEEKKDLDNSIMMCDGILKPGAVVLYDFDRYIYEYTYQNDIPFLGICGGMQIMSAYNKDSIRNIKIENSSINHSLAGNNYAHSVVIPKKTMLYSILGEDQIMVNSKHKYKVPDEGVHNICATSPDGVIEAIENDDLTFHLGLQWHPELMQNDENTNKIFTSFVKTCKKRR